MQRTFTLLTTLILTFAQWGTDAQAQGMQRYDDLETFAINHNGRERSLGLYIPQSYVQGRNAPLIVVLHGRYSSAKALHALSQLQEVAEARGALLVYPESTGAFWDDGGHAALQRFEPPASDLEFITRALNSIMADYTIDRDRVFAVGYDSGGAMAIRLACHPPVKLAGLAIVSALMWQFSANACAAKTSPTPVLIVHGRESEIFPVGGSAANPPVNSARLSVAETLAFWRNVNGCQNQPGAIGGDGSVFYNNCQSGAAVAYAGIPGASRDWFRVGAGYRLNQHGVNSAAVIDTFFFDRTRFALPSGRKSDGRPRDYLVYVPPRYDAKQPTPALVMLHGRPSSAQEMARITEMNITAERHGFIVVYPEGINNEWNAQFDLYRRDPHRIRGGGTDRPVLPQDDVGFLKTLVQDLRVDLNIDPQRMFISGFSNGGFMTMRMACSASDVFAGFAEVGATLHTIMSDVCNSSKPAPILFMHGTADPSIPFEGIQLTDPQDGSKKRITLSVKNTVALFAQRNQCALTGTSTTFAESGRSPGTHIVRFLPHKCAPGAPVVFYMINGGGHTWPGVRGVLPEDRFGLTNMDMHASETIWEFFAAQRLIK